MNQVHQNSGQNASERALGRRGGLLLPQTFDSNIQGKRSLKKRKSEEEIWKARSFRMLVF